LLCFEWMPQYALECEAQKDMRSRELCTRLVLVRQLAGKLIAVDILAQTFGLRSFGL